jgi:monovalent cation:proton antiporter-2 (CPA2) family protein
MTDSFLFEAFVYLLAAVIAVPIAKRLGLGSVLGYLLAGVAIGPFGLNLAGGAKDVMHFAEFGVVMMLFLIGLELKPALLWRMRGPILGMGGLQMLGTSLAVLAVAMLAGRQWRESLAIGLILAMSSTAIILQTLAEKNLLKTRGGQSCFSVLLFQDIAVIPLLALLPLLAMQGTAFDAGHVAKPLEHLPVWAQTLATFGAVAIIVVVGRWLLRPIFRFIAGTRLREAFTSATLLLVIGIALLMEFVGLSAALGTFLAGVVLSDSEYRHEIETDLEPFKGLLLGLFFLSVGSGIDFALIHSHPGIIALLVAGLVLVKFAVLLPIARIFRSDWGESLLFALAMAQGGDFPGGALCSTRHKVKRKAMNSFFCSTKRPFNFLGIMNEDVSAYTSLGSRGALFLTIPNVSIKQPTTQSQSGGVTETYKLMGTYCKSFLSVMMMPSSVRVAMMQSKNPRLHHSINWAATVPKIIDASHRRETAAMKEAA